MTKLRAVAHLGMGGGGWTESKRANLDKSDTQPSLTGLSPREFFFLSRKFQVGSLDFTYDWGRSSRAAGRKACAALFE
jgi:hypothetical protein